MDSNTQLTGVSNPPNNEGENVTTLAVPNSNTATISQSAAPNAPPPNTPTPSTAPVGQIQPPSPANLGPQPAQTPGQIQQTQQPSQATPGMQGKQPNLNKPTAQTAPTTAVPQKPVNPMVRKASTFHEVAEALAGGPRYKYTVDAYGNMQSQKVPVSNAHIALAIALEALGGAATGLGVPSGPNAAGRAAAAGFAQGNQQVIQQDQQARKQATDDYARRAQTLETNMNMYSTARNIGRQDAEATDKYVAQYAPLVEKLQTEYPGYVHGPVKYSDLSKYHVASQNAIPYMRVPRLDQDGKQVVDAHGVPQSDVEYLIVDPSFKMTNAFTPEEKKAFQQMGQTWQNNDAVDDTPLGASLVLNRKAQAASWLTANGTFNKFFDMLDQSHNPGAGAFTPTKEPTLPQPVSDLADKYGKEAGVDSRFVKALIAQESTGNTNAVSKTGATGLMQLTQPIAKQYGVTDRTNPEQNVKAGTDYFKDLLEKYKDPKLAFAAYYSGPNAIRNGEIVGTSAHSAADTGRYVQQVSDKIGLQDATTSGKEQKEEQPTLADWTKTHPSTPADVQKFMGALSQTGGNYSLALQHLIASGQTDSAGNISNFLGGPDAIKAHDDYNDTLTITRKNDLALKKQEQATQNKETQDEQVQQHKEDMINSLLQAQIPANILQTNDQDAVSSLRNAGVTLPTDAIVDAKAIANYKAPLTVASNKRWFKDAKMDQGELLSMVRMFNPSYDTKNFDALRSENMPNSPQRKTIDSAAQLANHLNTMLNVVNSQSADKSPIPMMNRLMQAVGYQTGGTQLTNIQAMANIVTSELGKTLAGGFAPDKEQVDNIIKTMNPANATNQMKSLIGLYIAAMHGKVAPLDDEYNQISGASDQHLVVPKSLTNLLKSYGYNTPWSKSNFKLPSWASAVTDDGKYGQDKKTGQWVQIPQGQ